MAVGTLLQLNVSPGGMPKLPVDSAAVSVEAIAGDWQLNRKYHGGPDRVVCLFSAEQYEWLRTDHGLELAFGSLGENFTTRGVDLDALQPGDRLQVGDCVIEITAVRQPCRNLNRWHPNLMKILTGRSGWVAKVIQGATVKPGDAVTPL